MAIQYRAIAKALTDDNRLAPVGVDEITPRFVSTQDIPTGRTVSSIAWAILSGDLSVHANTPAGPSQSTITDLTTGEAVPNCEQVLLYHAGDAAAKATTLALNDRDTRVQLQYTLDDGQIYAASFFVEAIRK